MSERNILVTGGAGYIGSHVCKALSAHGYTPITYDSLITGHRSAVKWGPLEVGDICDPQRLDKVISTYNPVAAIHFAAAAYVGESVVDPEKYYHNNVAGTISLVSRLRARNVDKIVFSSSCATYGIPEKLPITEADEQRPINPYGKTKLASESMLKDYSEAYGGTSVALRYFNAAGCDIDGEIGEMHDPETHLIPLVLFAARDQKRTVSIYGTDYDTPDGTCVRDYVHVSDLATAHVAALNLALAAPPLGFRGINLGAGVGISVKEIIAVTERITGRRVAVEYKDRRSGDPALLVADASLAQRILKWYPRHSDIETIVSTAWAWMTKE